MRKKENKPKNPLNLQEDMYFSKVADKRLSQKQKRIPHSKAYLPNKD